MNVVVLDSAHLAGEADFPMLDLPKFGWQQYTEVNPDDVPELCWRADMIVTVDTPINKEAIDKAFKLKLIVAASDSTDHIDCEAAEARGIIVCSVAGADASDAAKTAAICEEAVALMNRYIRDHVDA